MSMCCAEILWKIKTQHFFYDIKYKFPISVDTKKIIHNVLCPAYDRSTLIYTDLSIIHQLIMYAIKNVRFLHIKNMRKSKFARQMNSPD